MGKIRNVRIKLYPKKAHHPITVYEKYATKSPRRQTDVSGNHGHRKELAVNRGVSRLGGNGKKGKQREEE